MRYLTLDEAVAIARDAGWGPVRDVGLLDSALARPASSAFGEDAYPTVGLKVAALLHSVCANHPLVDGNKRLAWHLAELFALLNGARIGIDDDDAFDLVMDVAQGLDDLAKIAERLGLA
jgi:death-on-curing protein